MKKIIYTLLTVFLGTPFISPAQQLLHSTEDSLLVEVVVKDMNHKIRVHDRILFEGQKTKTVLMGITDESGKFRLLLPEGDTYNIVVKGLGENQEYNTFEVPQTPGRYSMATLTLQYEPAKVFTLKNLQFESGKATIRKGSEAILKELIELMQLKPSMSIEIAGHTDDTGSDEANMLLSQHRAEAVRTYLVQQGKLNGQRITAKGYGENSPIANNSTEEGKQLNRRTEVRILQE